MNCKKLKVKLCSNCRGGDIEACFIKYWVDNFSQRIQERGEDVFINDIRAFSNYSKPNKYVANALKIVNYNIFEIYQKLMMLK
jgi:hypothetical protein